MEGTDNVTATKQGCPLGLPFRRPNLGQSSSILELVYCRVIPDSRQAPQKDDHIFKSSTHNPLLVEDSLELMRGIDNILVDLIIYNHNTHKSVSRSINLAEERHSTYRNQLGHPTPLSQVHGVRIPIHKALASTSHIQQS